MNKLSLLLCLSLVCLWAGCKKEQPPAPAPEVQAPVTQPETTPAAPAPEAAAPAQTEFKSIPGNFTVQVAAWETKDSADKLAAFYQSKGYDARVENADLGSGQWYRVRIGNYKNSAEARQVAEEIREKYKSDIWLVKL
ncbi:MAG: SPOR domain-containing protein [Candidatus Glassbacteria bacterium]